MVLNVLLPPLLELALAPRRVLSKKLTLLPFHFASYDKVAGKMAFFDPKRKDDFVSAGTAVDGALVKP